MTQRTFLRTLALAATAGLAAAGPALAHPGHLPAEVAGSGLVAGFLHPFTGFGHMLAMLAVGAWAWRLGRGSDGGPGSSRLVMAAFPAAMLAGAALWTGGIALPALSSVLALSVIALGVVLATGLRVPAAGAAALVGLFAVFHGYAHAAAIPAGAAPAAVALGFVAATAVLQGAGFAAASLFGRGSIAPVRYAGTAVAACGALLMAAA